MLMVRWEELIQQLIAYKQLPVIKFTAAQGLCVCWHRWATVTWTAAFTVDSQRVSPANLLRLADCRPVFVSLLAGLGEHRTMCEKSHMPAWAVTTKKCIPPLKHPQYIDEACSEMSIKRRRPGKSKQISYIVNVIHNFTFLNDTVFHYDTFNFIKLDFWQWIWQQSLHLHLSTGPSSAALTEHLVLLKKN